MDMNNTSFQMLCVRYGELIAHAGLMSAAFAASPTDDNLEERFNEYLDSIIENIDKAIEEIQLFGSAFTDLDGDDEDLDEPDYDPNSN